MTISYQQALSWIESNPNATVAQLRDLVSQVSADVPGSKITLLYSGQVDNLDAWKIADLIGSNNPDIASINKTDVSKLLNDGNFISTLRSASSKENVQLNEILEGKNSSNIRISNQSMWDIASNNFVQNASGEVRTITANADNLSVFSQTEVPALLNNPKITSVNGQDISELKQINQSQGIGIVQDQIKQSSGGYVKLLETVAKAASIHFLTLVVLKTKVM